MRTNMTLIVAGAFGALALCWTLARSEAPAPSPQKPDPDLFAFVRSMDGTRPDGNVTVAAGDALVVDAELGHLFDYYLAGLGEKDLLAIRTEIERELDRRLRRRRLPGTRRVLLFLERRPALHQCTRRGRSRAGRHQPGLRRRQERWPGQQLLEPPGLGHSRRLRHEPPR